MDNRGSEFTNQEKVCVLLKSMKTVEAQKIVQSYANSNTGDDEAMEALTVKYGSPQKVFPLLVRQTLERGAIDFTEKGFAQLRERFFNPYKAMKKCGCDTLLHYLTALACEEFTPRLRKEWTKHISSCFKVPDLDDLFAYTKPLEHTLSSFNLPLPSLTSPSAATSRTSTFASTSKTTSGRSCPLCNKVYKLNRCTVYLGYDIPRKKKYRKSKRDCTNCLSLDHQNQQCWSSYNCRK